LPSLGSSNVTNLFYFCWPFQSKTSWI